MPRLLGIVAVFCVLLGGLSERGVAGELVYERKALRDSQGFQMEALHMLVPRGWDFQGQVTWNTQASPPAASFSLEVVSPDGRSRFTLMPEQGYFWSRDPGLQQSWSQLGTEILQPLTAVDYITQVYLPRVRGWAQVSEVTDLPAVAENARQIDAYHMQVFHQISPFTFPFQLDADAARVQAWFSREGEQQVEEISTTIHSSKMSMPSLTSYGQVPAISWQAQTLSFLAPSSRMQEQAKHMRVMFDSLTYNPAWALANIKLAATVTRQRIQARQAWFNAMQRVRQSQLEVSDMITQSYEQRSAAYDRIFDNYSQAIRSVDAYDDPVSGQEVELPNGYENAWTNGDTCLLSEDPTYNPNIGSTQNWEPMERRE